MCGGTEHGRDFSERRLRPTFLDRVFPVPEDVYRLAADAYLFELAPFFGKLVVIDEPQLLYRQHGDNDHVVIDLDVKVQRGIASLS